MQKLQLCHNTLQLFKTIQRIWTNKLNFLFYLFIYSLNQATMAHRDIEWHNNKKQKYKEVRKIQNTVAYICKSCNSLTSLFTCKVVLIANLILALCTTVLKTGKPSSKNIAVAQSYLANPRTAELTLNLAYWPTRFFFRWVVYHSDDNQFVSQWHTS